MNCSRSTFSATFDKGQLSTCCEDLFRSFRITWFSRPYADSPGPPTPHFCASPQCVAVSGARCAAARLSCSGLRAHTGRRAKREARKSSLRGCRRGTSFSLFLPISLGRVGVCSRGSYGRSMNGSRVAGPKPERASFRPEIGARILMSIGASDACFAAKPILHVPSRSGRAPRDRPNRFRRKHMRRTHQVSSNCGPRAPISGKNNERGGEAAEVRLRPRGQPREALGGQLLQGLRSFDLGRRPGRARRQASPGSPLGSTRRPRSADSCEHCSRIGSAAKISAGRTRHRQSKPWACTRL